MKGQNLVPIPGELSSVAVDGIVSSADGIYDYNKEKNQEDINEEVSESLGNIIKTSGTKRITW